MNEQNLKPLNQRTKSERRELAKKAGEASGEARRKKKALRELMQTALQMEEQNEAYRGQMVKAGWSGEDMSQMAVITQGLIQRAKTGDVQAYNAIRDIIGEKPVDETKMTGTLDTKLEIGFVESGIEPKTSESDVEI